MDFLFTTKTIMAQHNDTGQWGEDLAVQHLKSKGYTIRDRNWRSGHREIDIIALPTRTSTGDQTHFCLSLCGLPGSWCVQGLF